MNRDCVFEEGIDSVLIEFIVEMKDEGGGFGWREVMNVVDVGKFKRMEDDWFGEGGVVGNVVVERGI